jgi:hypothetical protein
MSIIATINGVEFSFNKVWHVATNGDDIIGDESLANPFATYSKAASSAAISGDGKK